MSKGSPLPTLTPKPKLGQWREGLEIQGEGLSVWGAGKGGREAQSSFPLSCLGQVVGLDSKAD